MCWKSFRKNGQHLSACFIKNRFEEEDCDDYASSLSGGKFSLQLKKKNVFVWADDELYRL